MTDLERIDADIESLQVRIDAAKRQKLEVSLRDSCRKLAEDEALPIVEIIKGAFVNMRVPFSNDKFADFVEQIAYRIKSQQTNSPRS